MLDVPQRTCTGRSAQAGRSFPTADACNRRACHRRHSKESDPHGHYEFPKVAAGSYTLRIARPREFYPFSKPKLAIQGDEKLDDITLLRLTPGEFLPSFPSVAAQLTGSEWLENLPGTGQEKKTLT